MQISSQNIFLWLGSSR